MNVATNLFRRSLCLLLIVLVIGALAPAVLAAPAPDIAAEAVLLADPQTGQIFYEKNIHTQRYPASTTKIMTALVVLEECELDEVVTVSETAYACEGYTGSSAGLQIGEQLTVEEMLYCLMLPSGNEAAYALAEHVSGTSDAFVELMNQRAEELGCENTVFYNPCGLPDENLTTAYDLFLMTREALKNETFATIVETAQHKLPATNLQQERTILTTNRLILRRSDPTYYSSCYGVKTGHTDGAGYCLVSNAIQDGGELISVMLGCEMDESSGIATTFPQTKALFEWCFDNFSSQTLVEDGVAMMEIPVRLSAEQDAVVVQTSGSITGIVPNDLDLSTLEPEIDAPDELTAPIAAGDKVGTVSLIYNGYDYGSVDLVAMQDVSLSQVLFYVDKLENFFSSTFFKVGLAVLGVFLIVYLFVLITLNRRKKRRYQRYRQRQGGAMPRYTGRRRRK